MEFGVLVLLYAIGWALEHPWAVALLLVLCVWFIWMVSKGCDEHVKRLQAEEEAQRQRRRLERVEDHVGVRLRASSEALQLQLEVEELRQRIRDLEGHNASSAGQTDQEREG